MELATILSTEDRLLKPICEFSTHDGYRVYRSDRFRNYYGGNGVAIDDPGGRSLPEWETVFRRHFPADLFEHITFTFPNDDRYFRIMNSAREAGYHVDRYSYLFVDNMRGCRPMPDGYRIHQVMTEVEWERIGAFDRMETVDEDWYDPTATEDRLHEMTRFTTRAVGIEWFYASAESSAEVASKLGLFSHRGIGRLQDVRTARACRRSGLATGLLSFAIRRAIDTLGLAGLAVCADIDYHAVELYRKLGFVDAGESVCLMKYPRKNHPV